jgi:aminoglycoside 6'-N-acetyltransferase I
MSDGTVSIRVRRANAADLPAVTVLAAALWSDAPAAEHEAHAAAIIGGPVPSTLPLVLFVAEIQETVVGFVEVGLRSHADGCDTRNPVGFIEGWCVAPNYRRKAVGRALMTAAEEWARAEGATELASDTWLDNDPSQQAHEALGFEVVDRCVNYRKSIG